VVDALARWWSRSHARSHRSLTCSHRTHVSFDRSVGECARSWVRWSRAPEAGPAHDRQYHGPSRNSPRRASGSSPGSTDWDTGAGAHPRLLRHQSGWSPREIRLANSPGREVGAILGPRRYPVGGRDFPAARDDRPGARGNGTRRPRGVSSGTVYMQMRDALGVVYDDASLVSLYAARGRPAEAP